MIEPWLKHPDKNTVIDADQSKVLTAAPHIRGITFCGFSIPILSYFAYGVSFLISYVGHGSYSEFYDALIITESFVLVFGIVSLLLAIRNSTVPHFLKGFAIGLGIAALLYGYCWLVL